MNYCVNLSLGKESFMGGMKEIIAEAEALPVEERVAVIDSLLRAINPPLAE